MQIFGKPEANTIEQLAEVDDHAVRTALMADAHFGYSMPVGGVAAFEDQVSVTGVGFDIACGNCAVKIDTGTHGTNLRQLGHEIQQRIAAGVGKANRHEDAPVDHPVFDSNAWQLIPAGFREPLQHKAREQLGSIGSGNHYIDILKDEYGFVWVGVHFGSRGFGHTIASNYIAISQGGQWGDRGKEDLALLDVRTPAGDDYWNLMQLAGEYAYAGREWVCRTVAAMISSAPIIDLVHNNHNFAWRETHNGRSLIVVRKGATPAWPNERGFVGGSMGDDAVILKGATPSVAGEIMQMQESALYSTVHGAGRVMSRTQATGRNRRGKFKHDPLVDADEVATWLKDRNVLVFGADLDEAPQAYRRLEKVLEWQGDTVEVTHRLRPLVVVMASNDFDDSGKPQNPFLRER